MSNEAGHGTQNYTFAVKTDWGQPSTDTPDTLHNGLCFHGVCAMHEIKSGAHMPTLSE